MSFLSILYMVWFEFTAGDRWEPGNKRGNEMGYQDAWAALNMEMPGVIPRTEYSATEHWPLVKAVTGINVDYKSSFETKMRSAKAFMEAWDYGLVWSTMVDDQYLKGRVTKMGHAEYAAGGVDRDDNVHCPFDSPEEVLAYDPMEELGIYDKKDLRESFESFYAYMSGSYYQDAVNMSGTYITLFSGLISIFGWEMLLYAGGMDRDAFGRVVSRYEKWISQFFDAFAETDIPVMMVHDDIAWTSGPVFHPEWYRKYIFPAYKRLWAPVIESGKRLIFTSDGDYTLFLDDIVACGAHCLVMEPMADMAVFAEKYGKTHAFIGNADTRILLSGSREDIRNEVKRCINIGKSCPGFIMAVGNHIPVNTPVENALYYNEVFEELRCR